MKIPLTAIKSSEPSEPSAIKVNNENFDAKPTTATMSTLANDSPASIGTTTTATAINDVAIYRLGHTATWPCRNCKIKADKWFMQTHACSGKK